MQTLQWCTLLVPDTINDILISFIVIIKNNPYMRYVYASPQEAVLTTSTVDMSFTYSTCTDLL